VIERAEQQDVIDAVVGKIERTSVANRAVDPRAVTGADLIDVVGHEITMNDVVPRVEQPVGVATRTTTDIRDPRRWRRKRSTDDLDRSAELDPTQPRRKTVAFLVPPVVRLHCLIGH
jgi:hypothetical protein